MQCRQEYMQCRQKKIQYLSIVLHSMVELTEHTIRYRPRRRRRHLLHPPSYWGDVGTQEDHLYQTSLRALCSRTGKCYY